MSDQWKDFLMEVGIPGLITVVFVLTTVYLAIVNRPLPEWLYGFTGTAVGYFLSSASASRVASRIAHVVSSTLRR